MRTYLDYAAAAPTTSAAFRAFTRALSLYGNPSAAHTEGRAASKALTDARTSIARLAGVKTDGVIFTSGATEANNLAIKGYVATLPAKPHILYAEGAHASIIEPIQRLVGYGATADAIPFKDGALDLTAMVALLRSETALVVVERVASETGCITNTREVRRVLDKHGAVKVLLHVDGSQAPFIDSIERTHLGADFVVLDAQKIGGVRGCGVLICSPRAKLTPMTEGGGQEGGIRSGTEALALAAAFLTALLDADKGRAAFVRKAKAMRAAFVARVQKEITGVEVNEGKENAPHIVNLSLRGRDTDYLQALLDEAGFAVSTRSACETEPEEITKGSRGVAALTHDDTRARATLRISWGRPISSRDLSRLGAALARSVSFLDQNRLQ